MVDLYDKIDKPLGNFTVREISFKVWVVLVNGEKHDVSIIKSKSETEDELLTEKYEIFHHYFKKLNKQFLHIRKPRHHAIRCSAILALYVTPIR